MAKKKELDNLSLDMIQCKKDGYGCHYGKWKAMQGCGEVKEKQLPEGWKICEWCGKWYKPKQQKCNQKYCEPFCQQQAQSARRHEKTAMYMRDYRAKRKDEKDG